MKQQKKRQSKTMSVCVEALIEVIRHLQRRQRWLRRGELAEELNMEPGMVSRALAYLVAGNHIEGRGQKYRSDWAEFKLKKLQTPSIPVVSVDIFDKCRTTCEQEEDSGATIHNLFSQRTVENQNPARSHTAKTEGSDPASTCDAEAQTVGSDPANSHAAEAKTEGTALCNGTLAGAQQRSESASNHAAAAKTVGSNPASNRAVEAKTCCSTLCSGVSPAPCHGAAVGGAQQASDLNEDIPIEMRAIEYITYRVLAARKARNAEEGRIERELDGYHGSYARWDDIQTLLLDLVRMEPLAWLVWKDYRDCASKRLDDLIPDWRHSMAWATRKVLGQGEAGDEGDHAQCDDPGMDMDGCEDAA